MTWKTLFRVLTLCLVFLSASLNANFKTPARPDTAVLDLGQFFTTTENAKLERLCRKIFEKTGVPLVVLTLPTLEEETIENVAVTVFKEWGIGNAKTQEGALIVLSKAERKRRIEVGYGSEGYLTDLITAKIGREQMRPLFKEGRFYEGVRISLLSMAAMIAKEKNIEFTDSPDEQATSHLSTNSIKINPLFLLLIVVLVIILSLFPGGRELLCCLVMMLNNSRGGSRGGFGGGLGGGGFGGYQGGSSGGGGSSGDW